MVHVDINSVVCLFSMHVCVLISKIHQVRYKSVDQSLTNKDSQHSQVIK